MKMIKILTRMGLMTIVSLVIVTMFLRGKSIKGDGWKDLFDGKTLKGWKLINQNWVDQSIKPEFYIENGMIVCNTVFGNKGGAYLVTEKQYGDFILEADVKLDTTLNSGVQCRGQVWENDTVTFNFNGKGGAHKWPKGYVWGYQIEIDPSFRAWSGGLYEPGNRGWLVTLEGNKKARRAFKPMGWNHIKIRMEGDKIQTWVNGVKIVEATDTMCSRGFIGLQFHGAYMDIQKNKKSYWKNIRVKEL